MSKDSGGPAFPFLPTQDRHVNTCGMTLRDYFAAKAMQGLIAIKSFEYEGESPAQGIARNAYEMADAMLEARK